MHLLMILVVLGLTCGLRLRWSEAALEVVAWEDRWQKAKVLFLFPPLLLMSTALAVLCMGPFGQMVWAGEGWFSYGLAIGFLGVSGVLWLELAYSGWRTLQQIRTYPLLDVGGKPSRLLDAPDLFSAQIGFWQPELIVSQGLLNTLERAHLNAVLAHEQAHYYYRDTFWFFWLGWLRRLTAWLPYTEALWQELLVLREIRADAKAAEFVDPLLLAESLFLVVSYRVMPMPPYCTAFSAVAQTNRLSQRIEALLGESSTPQKSNAWWSWLWLLLVFLPLATIPFHN